MTTASSPLGSGLSCTFCTCLLPFPNPAGILPVMVPVTTLQSPLGLGTSPGTSTVLPDVVSGRIALAESIVRRISTARGSLPDTRIPTTVGNYGMDVLDSIGADMNASDAGRLAASIDAQNRQDERVIRSSTTATITGSTLTIVIVLTDGTGPFKLTIGINLLTGNLQLLGSA